MCTKEFSHGSMIGGDDDLNDSAYQYISIVECVIVHILLSTTVRHAYDNLYNGLST